MRQPARRLRFALMDRSFETLESALRGELLTEEHAKYDETRRIHNGMIDRRPAAIVRCGGAADVMAALRHARDHDLEISIRGGGHGVPGFSVTDGGLMIDLSAMRGVRVDPAGRRARAEGGATWGDFDHETQAFGLATTGGLVRTTGIAGLTLTGGHGILMRKYGLACDNLLSADLVTAEGELVVASAEENPELFWGLRGGGGNFGVVTSFEYRLHPVGPVLGGLLIYPQAQARELLRFYEEFMRGAPDEVGALAVLATLPDGTEVVGFFLGYDGDLEAGKRALEPLRTFARPLDDQIGPMPYAAMQSIVEHFNPPGMRNYWKTCFLDNLSEPAIDTLLERHAGTPAPESHTVLYGLGGTVSRVGADETAVVGRDARYAVIAVGMWHEPSDDGHGVAWARDLWSAMQPHASGGFYPNYDAEVAARDRLEAAFGPEKYARLAALKNRFDPGNRFRLNQNIRPTA